MKRNPDTIPPSTMTLAGRLLGLSLMVALWLQGRGGAENLILVLFLCVLCLARWRFPRMPVWTVVFDQAACGVAMSAWPDAAFGLVIPILDSSAAGVMWLALPALAIVFARGSWSVPLASAFSCAVFFGWTVRLWSQELEAARHDSDRDRRERYDLESLKAELLSANIRSARMAEAAERARIARDLHDHAGHELTAAHLALQAYGRLRAAGNPQAQEMLDQAQRRVADGLEILRATVHGLAPARMDGLEAFEEICRRFTVCRVGFDVHGNTGRIPIHVWSILEPCLKEALANGARHAGAERIDVSLDMGPSIVRLSVSNGSFGDSRVDGKSAASGGSGMGLRNLRQRARAIGGSVSVDDSEGFRLICVLPLEDPPRP